MPDEDELTTSAKLRIIALEASPKYDDHCVAKIISKLTKIAQMGGNFLVWNLPLSSDALVTLFNVHGFHITAQTVHSRKEYIIQF